VAELGAADAEQRATAAVSSRKEELQDHNQQGSKYQKAEVTWEEDLACSTDS